MFVSVASELQITFFIVGKIVLPLEQLTYEWVFGLYLVRTDQWVNRKEWCLGSGRRRQLSQDRKDR